MQLDQNTIFAFASDLLREDLGRGDITTQAVVRGGAVGRGRFLAKQDFVLCGLEIAEAVFASLDNSVELESTAYDGDLIRSGTLFASIRGAGSALLAGERTALNLLQRLSAVATLTRSFVSLVEGTGAGIVDTRKTTPGLRLLEKYAVTVGGGRNHRFGLDDGVLIKDNHIALAGGVRRAVESARRSVPHTLKIEIEVGSESQLRDALAAGADVIMLDNMAVQKVRESVQLIRGQAPGTIIEVSGGVTIDNVREFAECGCDLISVGALTHSPPAIDISLKITPV